MVLLQFNGFTIGLGIASLGIVAVYPYMKRITSMPQLVLGFAFAWGGLMGWAAAFGRLDLPAVLIYLAAIVWTIGYDTIYALQDIEDDEVAGIKSSARLFGDHARLAIGILFALAVLFILGALVPIRAGLAAYLGLVGFAAHLGWQIASIEPGDSERALALFRSNRDAGLILFAGLVLDAVLNGG